MPRTLPEAQAGTAGNHAMNSRLSWAEQESSTPKPSLHLISTSRPGSSEEDFIHHVSTASASEGLLDDGFREPTHPRRPIWKRLLFSIVPGRRKHRSQESADASCLHCEKAVRLPRRRKGLKWCLTLGLGILIMLYEILIVHLVCG